MEKHPKSTPYRMKRSPLRNENDKLVITEKDGIQTRTKGNRTATYVINPDYDAKKVNQLLQSGYEKNRERP